MTLQEFIKKATWSPGNGIDSWSNYSGPDYSEYLQGPSRSRDSDLREESNFDVALKMLGGNGKHVIVVRFGHWGCGWFETILVSKKSKKKTQILFDIHKCLQNYPLLDDSDYSEREWDKLDEDFQYYEIEFTSAVLKYFKIDEDTASKTQLKHARSIAKRVQEHDMSWCGIEECFVTEESIKRFMQSYDVNNYKEELKSLGVNL